jgi:hypothetical protein
MPDETNLDLTLRALLFAALHNLEPNEKIDVLSQAGWNNQQIGEALGMTPNAIQKRRALKKAKA